MSRLARGDLRSKGYEALQNFATADALGVSYDYTTPVLTPPMSFGARYGWTVTADGLYIPGIVDDGSGNSTKGPVGGWLCFPPGSGSRTQPQWASSQFLVQVQSADPLEVAVVQRSDGTLSTDLSEAFACTLLVGAPAPAVDDYGFLIQPSRLDAQDPIFVPVKGGGGGGTVVTLASEVGGGEYTYSEFTGISGFPITGAGGTGNCVEQNGSVGIAIGTNVTITSQGGVNWFQLPIATC